MFAQFQYCALEVSTWHTDASLSVVLSCGTGNRVVSESKFSGGLSVRHKHGSMSGSAGNAVWVFSLPFGQKNGAAMPRCVGFVYIYITMAVWKCTERCFRFYLLR